MQFKVFLPFCAYAQNNNNKNQTSKQNKKNPAITIGMSHAELGNLQDSKFKNSDFRSYLTICLFYLPLKFKGVIKKLI